MDYRKQFEKKTKQPLVYEVKNLFSTGVVLNFNDQYVYWLEEQLKKRSADLTNLKKRYKKLASYD